MFTALIAGIGGLIGILVGGGVRAWEAGRTRRAEAASLLSALVAEVEALTRLARHRGYLEGLIDVQRAAQIMVDQGHGDAEGPWLIIRMKQSYFSVFEASVGKLGLLEPWHVDRIVRFYMYAKSVMENYDPDSPLARGTSASDVVVALQNDIVMLHATLAFGDQITSFRPVVAPLGANKPFEPAVRSGDDPERSGE